MASKNVSVLERVKGVFGGGGKKSKKKKGKAKGGRSKTLQFEDTRDKKEEAEAPKRKGPWPPERLQILQDLWGPGFLTVGGADAITELVHPLTLNSNMSVLELGAGIGGGTRHIHNETGAWVSGVENSVTLAKLGMEQSIMKGLQRKASVEHGVYTKLKVKPRSKDAMLAKEALFTVADKDTAFDSILGAIRPGGQLMYTDFMATGPELTDPAVAQWQTREPRRPHLWELERTRNKLEAAKMEVRVAEDITEKYRKRALIGFNSLVEKVKEFREDTERVKWVILEAEIWFHRLAALDSGEVNVTRIYARLPLGADV